MRRRQLYDISDKNLVTKSSATAYLSVYDSGILCIGMTFINSFYASLAHMHTDTPNTSINSPYSALAIMNYNIQIWQSTDISPALKRAPIIFSLLKRHSSVLHNLRDYMHIIKAFLKSGSFKFAQRKANDHGTIFYLPFSRDSHQIKGCITQRLLCYYTMWPQQQPADHSHSPYQIIVPAVFRFGCTRGIEGTSFRLKY